MSSLNTELQRGADAWRNDYPALTGLRRSRCGCGGALSRDGGGGAVRRGVTPGHCPAVTPAGPPNRRRGAARQAEEHGSRLAVSAVSGQSGPGGGLAAGGGRARAVRTP